MSNKSKKLEKLSVADLMFGKELLESDILDLLEDFEDKYGVPVRMLRVDVLKDGTIEMEASLDV